MTTIKTKRGKELDFTRILASAGDTLAAGNTSMNARGDIVGDNGKILKTAKEVNEMYYRENPNAIKSVSIQDSVPSPEVEPTPEVATKNPITKKQPKKVKIKASEAPDEIEE